MRKNLYVLCCYVLLLLILMACNEENSSPPPKHPAKVHGTISDLATNTTLGNVLITVYDRAVE